MSKRRLTQEQRNALQLYRDFREDEPRRIKRIKLELPGAVVVMGIADCIGYRTTHGKKGVVYMHDFAPGSRPYLCAGTRDNQLFLIGGRFRVTERGIVDLDSSGNEIDDDHGADY